MTKKPKQYIFDIDPFGKPRMVSSDKWKIPKGLSKKCVYDYIAFGDELRLKANLKQFVLPDEFMVEFSIPMPNSWAKKKKHPMIGAPHQQKPDIDNLVKSVLDILKPDGDQGVWSVMATKRWCIAGQIKFII